MKKLTTLFTLAICIITSFIFTACGNNAIEMAKYFSPTVTASVYKSSKADTLKIDDITKNEPYEAKKYTQFLFTADNNWFYGMYVESISFYIYATETKEMEFSTILTGMENGVEILTSTTKDFRDNNRPCYLKANESIKVTIPVNDTVYLSSSNSKLTIAPSDATYAEFENSTLMYCIHGLEIIAYHK